LTISGDRIKSKRKIPFRGKYVAGYENIACGNTAGERRAYKSRLHWEGSGMVSYDSSPRSLGDQAELFEGGFEVVNDFLGNDFRIGKIGGVFE
jgi:hypothetical protein